MTVPSARSADPVVLFRAIAANHERCFWLDGSASRPWSGNKSILGWLTDDDVSLTYSAARREVTRHSAGTTAVIGDDIFDALESEMAGDSADVLWVGYFGYASRPDLPASTEPRGMPDAIWMRARNTHVITHGQPREDAAPVKAPPPSGPPDVPGAYAAAFARVQQQLHAGNTYEVNLTHRQSVSSVIDPVTAYLRLRTLNPAPYAGFLQHQGRWLLSSSPERYATIHADRMIETRPIKGTTPRGLTPELDEQSRRRLATDAKFRAENLMIVDLLRNDVGMVSKPGSVEVPLLMNVESYVSVHQLVSTVRGQLRDDVTTLAALRALFPAGSMTGAPKLRTMEVIRDVEATPRGVYSGAFGWISSDGRADLAVVIRSLTTEGDGHWTVGTGGGITVQSVAADEYAEATWKAAKLIEVLDPCSTSPGSAD
ncbi:anthranilate synthase component I family protein [Hoyosella altamirensis]|uniref:Para-aminobenzoate synthetase n=1 Tax=Hoyosella altamirensis TaxID=616997 RepID=A0A839RT15_9ACTN|nr:anthranilate synthase component I family protein [Hoyosella altamirensis]MBB3039214.1 para-aminobenzoate synthetase [Hoyosella altamirensis]